MTKRIFKSIFLAAFCVLLASLVIITGCLYEYYSKTFENQMRDELDLAAAAVDISGSGYLKAIAPSGYRLSLIDKTARCFTTPYRTRTRLQTMRTGMK